MSTNVFDWGLDVGVSYHMTSEMHALTNLFYLPQVIYIALPDGEILKVRQAGIVDVGHGLILKNVLYLLDFKHNLISAQ